MFYLKVLGSDSTGNGYVITNGEDSLIIEAGVKYKEALVALNYDISTLSGLIISHEHKDHSSYIKQYVAKRLPIYMPRDTMNNLNLGLEYNVNPMDIGKSYEVGNFRVQPFELQHSCTCYGYYISHKVLGKMLFITDTEYVKYNFKKVCVNHILIEANYSRELYDRHSINAEHILKGHMNIKTTTEFLKKNDTEQLKNVVLLHLSSGNSNEVQFKELAIKAVHYGVNVYVADKGLNVAL